ncbi:MAG: IcmK protein [Gammaproteobacteria bacterium]|jgi:intracellular multiplication protein IcmK|nr:IcmK protein [Gammaproteobacteria bacterium]
MHVSKNNISTCFSKAACLAAMLAISFFQPLKAETAPVKDSSSSADLDPNYALLQQVDLKRQELVQQAAPAASENSALPVPAVTAEPEQNVEAAKRDAVFNAILQQTLPMTPSQIERLHRMYDKTQEAAATAPRIPPSPTSTSQVVDLSPGAVPPVIRLSQGFVTSLVFIDSTGAAWPIEAYDLGNPKAFNIQWDKNNTLMLQAINPYTYGNLAVKLKDQTTPVMVTLVPGQRIVDYRVDLRLSAYGPNANMTHAETGLPGSASPLLLSVLDGIPPPGSQTVHVDGGEAQAWRFADKLYLRTRYNVLSPAWLAKMSSADGTNAYEMPSIPIVLVERSGKTTQLRIGGENNG